MEAGIAGEGLQGLGPPPLVRTHAGLCDLLVVELLLHRQLVRRQLLHVHRLHVLQLCRLRLQNLKIEWEYCFNHYSPEIQILL